MGLVASLERNVVATLPEIYKYRLIVTADNYAITYIIAILIWHVN